MSCNVSYEYLVIGRGMTLRLPTIFTFLLDSKVISWNLGQVVTHCTCSFVFMLFEQITYRLCFPYLQQPLEINPRRKSISSYDTDNIRKPGLAIWEAR